MSNWQACMGRIDYIGCCRLDCILFQGLTFGQLING